MREWQEVGVAWIRFQDLMEIALQRAAAANRPHKCWPSRWGWMGVVVLLVYVVCMHSFWVEDRQEVAQQMTLFHDTLTHYAQQLGEVRQACSPPSVTPRSTWWRR